MLTIPSAAYSIFMSFSTAFTKPTFQRVLPLAVGAVLTRGRHTVTNILWTMCGFVPGHCSSYHRVFSRATWSLWPLGRTLATAILSQIPAQDPVLVPMDDTTAQHRGKYVYGKGCHHDAVRSAHKHVVFRWGHRWIVLAIAMKFPFTSRSWALPVLVALYRPEALNTQEGRGHKTAIDLARQLMAVLIHWFPERQFVFLGDGGYASHELAEFCLRQKRHASHALFFSSMLSDIVLILTRCRGTPKPNRPSPTLLLPSGGCFDKRPFLHRVHFIMTFKN